MNPIPPASTPANQATTEQLQQLDELTNGPSAATKARDNELRRLQALQDKYSLVYPPLDMDALSSSFHTSSTKPQVQVIKGRTYLFTTITLPDGTVEKFPIELKVHVIPPSQHDTHWWQSLSRKATPADKSQPVEIAATPALGNDFKVGQDAVTHRTRPAYVLAHNTRYAVEVDMPRRIHDLGIRLTTKPVSRGLETVHYEGDAAIAYGVEVDGAMPLVCRINTQGKLQQLLESADQLSETRATAKFTAYQELTTTETERTPKLGQTTAAKAVAQDLIFTMPSPETNLASAGSHSDTSLGTLRIRPMWILRNLEEVRVPFQFQESGFRASHDFFGGPTLKMGYAPGTTSLGRASKPTKTQISGVKVLSALGEIDVALIGPRANLHMTANEQTPPQDLERVTEHKA